MGLGLPVPTSAGVDRGTTELKVRIVGPKRLDSGPFVKVTVDGKDGNPCALSAKGTNGC
jgi:hypothetical protein